MDSPPSKEVEAGNARVCHYSSRAAKVYGLEYCKVSDRSIAMAEAKKVTPKRTVKAAAVTQPITPMHMLQVAVEGGADLDKIEKLMDLERRWKADQARDAYVKAMNAFRNEAVEVIRRKSVSFGNTNYSYATLANILSVAVPELSKHGLSHRWGTSQDKESIKVTCVITHELGHSEQTSLAAAADQSGGKNSIQAIGSAVSYLERYTFMAITGLAARDQDDDGIGADPVETISEEQVADLEALITEVNAGKAAFLKYLKVESLDQIPVKSYPRCVAALEAKRK